MKHVAIATRCREFRDDSDKRMWDNDESLWETIAMIQGTIAMG